MQNQLFETNLIYNIMNSVFFQAPIPIQECYNCMMMTQGNITPDPKALMALYEHSQNSLGAPAVNTSPNPSHKPSLVIN